MNPSDLGDGVATLASAGGPIFALAVILLAALLLGVRWTLSSFSKMWSEQAAELSARSKNLSDQIGRHNQIVLHQLDQCRRECEKHRQALVQARQSAAESEGRIAQLEKEHVTLRQIIERLRNG